LKDFGVKIFQAISCSNTQTNSKKNKRKTTNTKKLNPKQNGSTLIIKMYKKAERNHI